MRRTFSKDFKGGCAYTFKICLNPNNTVRNQRLFAFFFHVLFFRIQVLSSEVYMRTRTKNKFLEKEFEVVALQDDAVCIRKIFK